MTLVRTEVRDRVAVVTLDDPQRRNAMSLAMAESLCAAFDDLRTRDVGAAVITGSPPAFSAGADLSDLESIDRGRLERIYDGFLAVAGFQLPTIAAVNGPAVGAGLNLALVCDLRVACPGARFESRFIDLALHPGGGHAWMLRQLIGPQGAAAMLVFGESIDGEAAARLGLIWKCVPEHELMASAMVLASRAAAGPPELVERLKADVRVAGTMTRHEQAVEWETEHQLWSMMQEPFKSRLAALKKKISSRR